MISRLTPLALFIGLCGCTADLRPERLEDSASAEARGRSLLNQAAEAQGGLDAFRAHPRVSMTLVDEWPHWFSRSLFSPWPDPGTPMQLDGEPASDTVRLTFLEGDARGEVLGIQDWITWRADAKGQVEVDPADDPDTDQTFWLPTTQYFPFMTFRLTEGTVIRALEPASIKGRPHDRVYITWGQVEASPEVDQYVAWIDRETGLLTHVQYTVREFGRFVEGRARFEDFRTVGPLKLPHRITILDDLEDDEIGLHRFVIRAMDLSPNWPADHLRPAGNQRGTKPAP